MNAYKDVSFFPRNAKPLSSYRQVLGGSLWYGAIFADESR